MTLYFVFQKNLKRYNAKSSVKNGEPGGKYVTFSFFDNHTLYGTGLQDHADQRKAHRNKSAVHNKHHSGRDKYFQYARIVSNVMYEGIL